MKTRYELCRKKVWITIGLNWQNIYNDFVCLLQMLIFFYFLRDYLVAEANDVILLW